MKRIIDKETNIFIRDDFDFNPETEIGLEVEPSQGLFLPKWDGTQWVEALTNEAIAEIKAQAITTEPTLDERVEQVESKTATLEETLEVLFG